MTRECIPVTPAQHYFMGGIKVDLRSRTSMADLYAVGEASCNGVHGKNRLASNSLLESLVFALESAEDITKELKKPVECQVDLGMYQDVSGIQEENRRLVLEEIKRKDGDFYDKWCNNGGKH